MGKRDYNYFDALEIMTEYNVKAVEKLKDVLTHFDPSTLKNEIKEIHKIEHAADEKKHELMKRLAKEFITPIETEDIITLAQEIDDITDLVEDILQKLYIYNVSNLRKEAVQFTDIIYECCTMMMSVMKEFKEFKKSKTIKDGIIEINRLEETGDELYLESVRNLFAGKLDPVMLIVWTETLGAFEKACDAIEHAANTVESVIMKNN